MLCEILWSTKPQSSDFSTSTSQSEFVLSPRSQSSCDLLKVRSFTILFSLLLKTWQGHRWYNTFSRLYQFSRSNSQISCFFPSYFFFIPRPCIDSTNAKIKSVLSSAPFGNKFSSTLQKSKWTQPSKHVEGTEERTPRCRLTLAENKYPKKFPRLYCISVLYCTDCIVIEFHVWDTGLFLQLKISRVQVMDLIPSDSCALLRIYLFFPLKLNFQVETSICLGHESLSQSPHETADFTFA